jgi:hypothetical protein
VNRVLAGVLCGPVALVALGSAPSAFADVGVSVRSAKLVAPYVSSPTDAVVVVKLEQTSYENISLDVTLPDFVATKEREYGEGTCPTSIVRVISELEIFECGYAQEGRNVVLRLAIEGTETTGKVKIRIKSAALTAPQRAGTYDLSVSSWAFDPVTTPVTVLSGPLK